MQVVSHGVHLTLTVSRFSPGHRIAEHPYVVLHGSHLRVTVPVLQNGRSFTVGAQVTTPRVAVRLTASDAPQGHPSASGEGPVTLRRPAWAHGKLLYEDAALCGANVAQQIDWTPGLNVLRPGCSPVQTWDVVAGWPNHSVATVEYASPSLTPTPVPTPATLTIQALAPPAAPYRVRVGDTIELHVLGFGPTFYLAAADPTHLELEQPAAGGRSRSTFSGAGERSPPARPSSTSSSLPPTESPGPPSTSRPPRGKQAHRALLLRERVKGRASSSIS